MHLHAAIVPPRHVVRGVLDVVRRVEPPAPPEEPRKGWRARRAARAAGPVAPAPSGPLLEILETETVRLPITSFGNVTTADARRITDTIAAACAELVRPRVWLTGVIAPEPPDDLTVWTKVACDAAEADALRSLGPTVTGAVERVGFFVDRRGYRPKLAVANVLPSTPDPYLDAVLDALAAYTGPAWEIDAVTILKRSNDPRTPGSTELERIPVGDLPVEPAETSGATEPGTR